MHKQRKFCMVLCGMVLLTPGLAQAETIIAHINGLVCAYCVQGIEKAFRGTGKVEAVQVNLDEGWVRVRTRAHEVLSDKAISDVITDAGYNVTKIRRE